MSPETVEPTRPTDVTVADVYKSDRLAGRLERRPGETVFVYDDAYLSDDEARPVAFTLPKTDEPRSGSGNDVPAFFAGLLPEGRRLTALATRVKTSVDDALSLLLAVGSDTIGDVRIFPSGAAPSDPEPLVDVEALADTAFDRLFLASLGIDDPTYDRASIPGVQAKVSAGRIAFPLGGRRGRSCILKLSPPEYPHLVENEAFFLQAARACGVDSATASVVADRDGHSGLLVERFDRAGPDGTTRLPVEDACQMLDRYPGDKYLVTYEDVLTALAAASDAPAVTLQRLFRQLVFAYLIGNGDVHAKNLSIFRDSSSGLWTATPGYDLLSTSVYGDHTMALSAGGRTSGLTRHRFLDLARAVGIRDPAAHQALDEVCDGASGWIGDLGEIGFDERRTHKLRKGLEYRREELGRG